MAHDKEEDLIKKIALSPIMRGARQYVSRHRPGRWLIGEGPRTWRISWKPVSRPLVGCSKPRGEKKWRNLAEVAALFKTNGTIPSQETLPTIANKKSAGNLKTHCKMR